MKLVLPMQYLFKQKRPVFLLLCLALLLMLPSLWAGLFADDYSHALLLQGSQLIKQPNNLSLWQLFTFVDGSPERNQQLMQFSLVPWWVMPDFSMVFWRPLAELSHALDYALWPKSPWLMHAHSLLWLAAFFTMAQWSLRPLLPRAVFLWTLLLFAVDASHGFTVSWLANRNALMAGFFIFAALAFYQKLLQRQKLYDVLFLNIAVALAFASAEVGITAGVVLLAYSVFYGEQPLIKKWLWLLPSLALFIAWLWLYKSFGYGASGNQFYYADLMSEPLFFLENFATRLPIALSMLFSVMPWHYSPGTELLSIATGVTALLALLIYCYRRKQAYLNFALMVLLLAIVPISAAEIQERNLLIASIASAILLADVLVFLLTQTRALWQSLLLWLLVLGHVYLSIIIAMPMAFAPKLLAQPAKLAAMALPESQQKVISFGLPLFSMAFVSQIRLYQQQSLPSAFINVTTQLPEQVEFLGDNTWRVSHGESLFSGEDYLLRDFSQKPFAVGQSVVLEDLTITVEVVNEKQEPTQLLLQGQKNQQYQLLQWQPKTRQYQELNQANNT